MFSKKINSNFKINDEKFKLIEKITNKFDKFFTNQENNGEISLDIKLINTQGGANFKAKYTFPYRSVQIIGKSDECTDCVDAVRNAQEDAERQMRKIKTKHENKRVKTICCDSVEQNEIKEKNEYGPKITVKKIKIPEGITALAAIDLMESEGKDMLTYLSKDNRICVLLRTSSPNSYKILMQE